MKPSGEKKLITSLQKALCILEAIASAPHELKIVELVKITGFGRSSVQRLTHTLCTVGALSRSLGSNAFSLGNRITRFGYSYLSAHPIIEVALPYLVDLNATTDLGCELWILDNTDMISAARIPSLSGSEPITATGHRVSTLHSTAGVAVYSALPSDVQNKWLSIYQSQSGDKHNKLGLNADDMTSIAKTGYYFDPRENRGGLSTWSATVFDYSGIAVAAVCATQHIDTSDQQQISEIGQRIAQCASALSNMRILTQHYQHLIDESYTVIEKPAAQDKDPLFIAAVSRGLALLDCLTPPTPSLTLTDLSHASGFSMSMVQRLSDTLLEEGYILRDANQKTFTSSVKSLDLLYGFQSKNQILKVIWPRLLKLRKLSGLRCSFCVLDHHNIIHLLHIQGTSHSDFRTAFAGRSLPALSTSGGIVLLSKKTDQYLDAFIENVSISAVTPYTTTDKNKLKNTVKVAREKGFGFTDQQSILNEVNVAVAVERTAGEVVGAIVISAPRQDWSYERLEAEIVPLLEQASLMRY